MVSLSGSEEMKARIWQIFVVIAIIISTSVNVLIADTNSVNYDYVIITTDELRNSVNVIKNWKEELGFSVNITTVSWIYNQYSGRDDPEKIRNFLIDKYDTWEIKYVLIAGSIDSVPMRYCYPDPANHNLNDWIVPTDYYYADLTGDWDADGDGYYGEGKNNSKAPSEAGPFNSTDEEFEFFFQFWDDKVDFDAEVYVGRIPIDESNRIQNVLQKIISYEQSNDLWKKKVLLLGPLTDFYLGDMVDFYSVDEGYFMDELKNSLFEPNNYQVTTMYEKEGLQQSPLDCDDPINNDNVLKYWQTGYGIVCFGGHGSSVASIRRVWLEDDGDNIPEIEKSEFISPIFIHSDNTTTLDHNKPSIVFSISCNNARPENDNNLGSSLMKNGAIAFIGATRILHSGAARNYSATEGYGPIRWNGNYAICQDFFRYLINESQSCGKALYNSKFFCYNLSHRYKSLNNIYGLNLYGDPSLGIQQIQEEDQNGESYEDKTDSTPGFDLILAFCAIALVFFWKRKRI
jgi:hypothetical protein